MKVYLDTNILRDYMENRKQKSIELVECVRQKNLECYTSSFSMMELSDLQKDTLFFQKTVIGKKWDVDKFLRQRRQKDLSENDFKGIEEYLTAINTKLSFLKFANLGEEGWRIAQYISAHSPLTAVDTIHLTTAYTAGCNLLVTEDNQFITAGSKILERGARGKDIKIINAEEAIAELSK